MTSVKTYQTYLWVGSGMYWHMGYMDIEYTQKPISVDLISNT